MGKVTEKILGWFAFSVCVVLGVVFLLPLLIALLIGFILFCVIGAVVVLLAVSPLATYLSVSEKQKRSEVVWSGDVIEAEYTVSKDD